MSALTDLFTAMANKIRSKTGTATTYTPSEMVSDGIDDVYDAGVASATTPITPSNSSPASMTANTGYKPTANGYAIASYSSVTPSSTQTAVSSGDIVKIGGSGVIVDTVPPTPTNITPSNANPKELIADRAVKPTINGYAIEEYLNILPSNSSPATLSTAYLYKPGASGYAIQSYSNITPSNSSPVSLSSGSIYKTGGNGYAIDSYSSITPSNSSPVSLSSGSFYKPSASGYAISSYSSKSPSDTSPASVSSGAIIKASAAGYLVKNTPVNIGVPDIVSQANMSANASRSITVTKMPRYVIFLMTRNGDSTGRNYSWFYDVGKSAYSLIQYTADGYSHSENTGAPTTISATSSSVTVTNTTAATCRTHALIYY